MNPRIPHLKTLVKFALLIAVLMVTSVTSVVGSEFHQNTVRIVQVDVADPGGIKTIVVESTNGDVFVSGSDTNIVIIEAEISVNGRDASTCNEIAHKVDVQPITRGNRMIIDPDLPKKLGYHISISYKLIVPKDFGAELETSNGDLSASQLIGDVSMESTNGGISAVGVIGDVDVSSVNGGITLSRLVSRRVSAGTVNGGIECNFINKAPDFMEISTVNGAITATIPRGASAMLFTDTVNGGLSVVTGQGQITSKSRGSINMTLGDGQGKYDLSSVNGSISFVVANSPD